VKEPLRQYKDQAMQIDASEVLQLLNPGDGLIQKYTIIGPAPEEVDRQVIQGIRISIESDFDRDCFSDLDRERIRFSHSGGE